MQVQSENILFFPQNRTHIDNMLPIAKKLAMKGYDVVFFDSSLIYNQDIYDQNFQFKIIKLSLRLNKAFAFLSFYEKIKFIRKYKKELENNNFEAFDSFVYGNDGALQRVFIAKYKSKKHYLILDGIVSDYSFSVINIFKYSKDKLFDAIDYIRRSVKKKLNIVFAYLPYNYYFPSDVGCSRLTKIFVLSEYVADFIRSQILRNTQIIVSGMPRYQFLIENELKTTIKDIKILYVTQGYTWHNEYENDSLQHETIKKLIHNLEKSKLFSNFRITIRIHPRDNIRNYSYLKLYPWIILEDKSVDIYHSIKNNDVVIGVNSTVLLEAMSIGKKVIFLFLNNQYWRFERSFINHKVFNKVFSFERLLSQIENTNIDKINRDRFEYFFNPNSEQSIDIIVNEITEND